MAVEITIIERWAVMENGENLHCYTFEEGQYGSFNYEYHPDDKRYYELLDQGVGVVKWESKIVGSYYA